MSLPYSPRPTRLVTALAVLALGAAALSDGARAEPTSFVVASTDDRLVVTHPSLEQADEARDLLTRLENLDARLASRFGFPLLPGSLHFHVRPESTETDDDRIHLVVPRNEQSLILLAELTRLRARASLEPHLGRQPNAKDWLGGLSELAALMTFEGDDPQLRRRWLGERARIMLASREGSAESARSREVRALAAWLRDPPEPGFLVGLTCRLRTGRGHGATGPDGAARTLLLPREEALRQLLASADRPPRSPARLASDTSEVLRAWAPATESWTFEAARGEGELHVLSEELTFCKFQLRGDQGDAEAIFELAVDDEARARLAGSSGLGLDIGGGHDTHLRFAVQVALDDGPLAWLDVPLFHAELPAPREIAWGELLPTDDGACPGDVKPERVRRLRVSATATKGRHVRSRIFLGALRVLGSR
ncbi:MAG: hypothetical protein AAF533_07045 [Acidobacteriota bacterium]